MKPDNSRIPTSVLDFQSSGKKLHFQYDMSVVAAAAAEKTIAQLREECARLGHRLARAQSESQTLLAELGLAQSENARVTKALARTQVESADQGRVARKEREARARAEEQLRTAQRVNRGLQAELEVVRRTLEAERRVLEAETARSVNAASMIARLRLSRNLLRTALQERVSDYASRGFGIESAISSACSISLDEQDQA